MILQLPQVQMRLLNLDETVQNLRPLKPDGESNNAQQQLPSAIGIVYRSVSVSGMRKRSNGWSWTTCPDPSLVLLAPLNH